MNIMAFDSSAKVASVAVCSETEILAEFSTNTGLTHSQTLLPMAEQVLACANISMEQIDAFAVASGPGSFTGLRIGISAVKGMAQVLDKPCIGVSTLEGLIQNLQGLDGIGCAVMDARCNQVYNCLYTLGEYPKRLCDDRALTIAELTEELKTYHQKIILVGDGADLCYNKMDGQLEQLVLAPIALRKQRASSIGYCAHTLYQQGKAVPAQALMPSYLRLSQAERMRQAAQQNQ